MPDYHRLTHTAPVLHNIDYIMPEEPAVTKEEAASARSLHFTFWLIQRGAQQKHQAELLKEPWNFLSSRMNERFAEATQT